MLKHIGVVFRNPLYLITIFDFLFARARGSFWKFFIRMSPVNNVGARMRVSADFFISSASRNCRISIGHDFYARRRCSLVVEGGELAIGDNVFMNNSCSINCISRIIIGSDCLFGEGVRIYDHDHDFSGDGLIKDGGFRCSEVRIGNNVWLGSNVVVLRGSVIGDNVVVGANTVIRGRVPDNVIVVEKGSRELSVRPMI